MWLGWCKESGWGGGDEVTEKSLKSVIVMNGADLQQVT